MSPGSERILILAPFGRDGQMLKNELLKGEIEAEVCPSFERFCESINEGAGAILIGDEALGQRQVAELSRILKRQPEWSDLSLLVMTSGGQATLASERRLQLLAPIEGPTTLLERPLRRATLLSTVRAALRSRRRQYLICELLERGRQNAEAIEAANAALRRSNESLGEFAYVVSHDLQEPLRTVFSYMQLLSRRYRGRLDAEADTFIEFATDAAHRMTQLIRDLLDYAQVTQRGGDNEAEADCNRVLGVVTENLRVSIEESGARLTFQDLPWVAADFRQVAQLFQNLIGNAIKYRKELEAPLISVRSSPQDGFWLFEVADNGIGFEQEYAEQIFGVFKRLHRDNKKGTGIGLAICKRIVEHYGGRIWAVSSPRNGAVFSFLLPRLKD